MKDFINVLKKAFDFSGRSRRKEYWMFILFSALISIVLAIIEMMTGLEITENVGILTGLFSLLLFIPSLSVTIRRLHDIGRSGWWVLFSIVPVIGWITIFIFTVLDSQPGSNTYGPNPKESKSDYAFSN